MCIGPANLWHVLRHTYASVLAAGGVKRHELEALMGHSAPGTTSIYTHLFRESYESVHDALDRVYGHDRPPLRVVSEASTTMTSRRVGASRF